MMETAFSAIRLSCWGLGLVLAWLVAQRLRDKWTGRALDPNESAIDTMHPVLVLVCGGMVASTTLLAFTAAILNSVIVWFAPRYPLAGYLSLVCLFVVLILFIRQVAYHPARKMRFCAVWLVLSHFAVWGQVWFRQV